jgi:hypothetical protein
MARAGSPLRRPAEAHRAHGENNPLAERVVTQQEASELFGREYN